MKVIACDVSSVAMFLLYFFFPCTLCVCISNKNHGLACRVALRVSHVAASPVVNSAHRYIYIFVQNNYTVVAPEEHWSRIAPGKQQIVKVVS